MKIIKTTLILLLLAACGGGGSDGGGGGNRDANDPSCNISGNSATDSPTCTDEFLVNYGLDLINAEAVYDEGYPITDSAGERRVVAVLDTGIDTDHEAFAGRIHPASRNLKPNTAMNPLWDANFIDHYCDVGCDHGTIVASVVAAAKNGIQMHGVAYNAEILVLKSDFIDSEGNNEPYPAGISQAVDISIANNVDAINLSAGGRLYYDYDLDRESRREQVGMSNEDEIVHYVPNTNTRWGIANANLGAFTLELARATQNDIAIVFATGNDSRRRGAVRLDEDQNRPLTVGTGYPTALAGARLSDCDTLDTTTEAHRERLGAFCEADVRQALEAMPGYNAAEGPFNGLIVGVASVDADRGISQFSSLCDVTNPRYCLAAPGNEIPVAFNGGYTTKGEDIETGMMGVVQTTATGTSYSAPHVAGAIALLRSTFPMLTSKQAVRIILETADDVIPCAAHVSAFDCFNDDYGNGILNLRRALGPLGDLGFRTQAGEPAGGEERTGGSEPSQGFLSISSATLSLPMAFGDALGRESLGRIVAYDDYQRGYVINLAPRVNRQGFEASLDSILSFDSFEQETGQTSLNLGRFSLTTQFSTNLNEEDTEQVNLSSLHFSADLGGASIGFATGGSSRPTTLSFYGEALRLLGITQATPSPYAHLVQNGAGLTIDSRLKDWAISYGLRQGDGASGASTNKSASNALAFDIKAERSFDSGIYLGGLVLVIAEQNSFLAASGRGVFKAASGTTQSLTLGMGYAQGNTRVFGQISGGQTKISLANDSGAILSDFSAIKTSAALIGMSQEKVFATTDRFDIVLSRPLKVSSASATLNADSSGTDVSGQSGLVASGTSRVSLAPSGQQTNLELTYTNAFSKTTKLSLGLALINQPAHNAAAKNERALALRWVKHF